MSNSTFYESICANECRNTHHKLVMNSLQHLACPNTDQWRSTFERYFEYYLDGSKAPDKKFKDFRNHVLHVSDNYWGGPVKQAEKWYALTVEHLKNEDWKSAVYSAGVLSHYYMDVLMPLHTAQSEEEGVIHRACEWSVNKSFDRLIEALEQESGYPDITLPTGTEWLKETIHTAAETSHVHYDAFIDHYNLALGSKDPPAGLDKHLRTISGQLLGHASVGFARIIERAISESNASPKTQSTGWLGWVYKLTAPVSWSYKGIRHFFGQREVNRIANEYRTEGKVIQTLPQDEKTVRTLHAEEILKIDLAELNAREIGPVGSKVVSSPTVRKSSSNTPPERSTREPTRSEAMVATSTAPNSRIKFRLNENDSVEAAPSIGKKTSARLEDIGIYTVADLLEADPIMTAISLSTRHIDAETIKLWQRQTKLACRIPMIYGHDAQILEACGFESPEEIAESEPEMILSLVDDFRKTEEAKFIIRGSNPPDLAEVSNWIEWSRHSRNLKAA